MALLFVLLLINFAISTWNAWIVGKVWDMCEGATEKLLLWCGLIQSVIGYSSVALIGIIFGGYYAGWFDEKVIKGTVSLWYLLIIIPVISTGFIIWIHSVISFLRRPTLTGGMAAAWNTYAQISNTMSALEHVPTAMGQVGELFKGGGGSDGIPDLDWRVWLVIAAVALSLIIGVTLTSLVFAASRRSVQREVHEGREETA